MCGKGLYEIGKDLWSLKMYVKRIKYKAATSQMFVYCKEGVEFPEHIQHNEWGNTVFSSFFTMTQVDYPETIGSIGRIQIAVEKFA